MPDIDLNPQIERALHLLENTQKHVFISGKAGTGKSTLLSYFRHKTRKQAVTLAPTGVAAVNIQGETIHSFFGFKPNITVHEVHRLARKKQNSRIIKALEMIILDEVSMVRADLLDCVDMFLSVARQNPAPFGGVQMVFIGDLYQLPPVLTNSEREAFLQLYPSAYFFDSETFRRLMSEEQIGQLEYIELEKVYRQQDQDFINLLNSIRNRSITLSENELLNERHQPVTAELFDSHIYLTATNQQAQEINDEHLNKLEGKTFYSEGEVSGDFDTKLLPTDIELTLKIGARVMFLNNDQYDRWINGTVGTIKAIHEEGMVEIELDDSEMLEVTPFRWDMYRSNYNADSGQIEHEVTGSFTQLPLKLAWAITIHKSQGKTFDKVIIDLGRGAFAPGQVYVALSRCRTFEGIILKQPIRKSSILVDYRVMEFLTKFQRGLGMTQLPLEDKMNMIRDAIENRQPIVITYLKGEDQKSTRTILPKDMGEMVFKGNRYHGVYAYCFERKDYRTFKLERILEIKLSEEMQPFS